MRTVKAEDLYEYRFLSRPALSPDGKRAVFTATLCDKENNAYRSDLWLLEEDGTVRPLTVTGDAKEARWLDNHTLAFPALRREEDKKARAEKRPLAVFQQLDLHGGEAQELLRAELDVQSAKPLSAGRWALLCKYSRHPEEEPDYEVLDEIPFWGNGLGFVSGRRNRLFVQDGKAAEPITNEQTQVSHYAVGGDEVLFSAHFYSGMEGKTDGVYLWKAGKTETLVEDGVYAVAWVGFMGSTPVALMSDMKEYGQSQNPAFYALTGGEPRLLSSADDTPGSTLIGDSAYGGGENILTAGEDVWYTAVVGTKTELRRLTAAGMKTVTAVDGTIDALAICGGRILICGVLGQRLSELYELKNNAFVRLTSFNETLFTERVLPAPKPLSAMSGDVRIDGFVLEPANYEPSGAYPAILNIHGGPKAAYGGQFFHEMQVWAAAGYFVFFCNPRGGEGRGNAFCDLRGQYGKIDYDDIMAFTDAVLEAYPQIDKNRLGVTGGSYGGFMTNWIIGHTDRFAAAASQRCVSNWVSKFLCTDIGYRYNAELLEATPWTDPEKMWWHSPVKYADRAKTPTLFIHSDEDYRCWLAEGLQMFTALRFHGVEARLCLFHGENHGLSRSGKPKHRVRRLNEITGWMDRYLK
ncbi:MAG: S9 family peptidase [Clostridiaceae bacterium]|nr:S9 family peptidase [Clostridiaceae bacterium]